MATITSLATQAPRLRGGIGWYGRPRRGWFRRLVMQSPFAPVEERCGERVAAAHAPKLLAGALQQLAVVAAVAVRLVEAGDVPVVRADHGRRREVSVQDGFRLVD